MEIRKLLVLTILGLSLTAAADFRTTMEVHEVELVNLRLPTSSNGTLSISECPDCNTQSIRVNAATRYTVNGKDVALADFRRALAGVRDREFTIIDVFHDLESGTVIRVRAKL